MTGPKQFKLCKQCETSKVVEAFYRRSNGYLSAWCKPCTITATNQAKAEKRRLAREATASLPASDKKRCTQCREEKPLSDFYRKHAECKECLKARGRDYYARPEVRARVSVQQVEYRERTRAAIRVKTISRYGITPDQYDARYEQQGGVCVICEQPGERLGTGGTATRKNVLVVDHCHDSGAVRGLLCNICNRAVGMLGDDPTRLMRAITYLTASRREVTPAELEAAADG